MRRLLGFFLPAGALCIAFALAAHYTALLRWLAPLEGFLSALILAVALLLGWRFDRSRLVFTAVVIGLTVWLLGRYASRPDYIGRIVGDALAVLLPFNLALLALLKERGIFTLHGLLRWALILVQPLLVGLLLQHQQYFWLGIFDTNLLPVTWLEFLPLKQPALLMFSAALLLTAYKGLRRHDLLEGALFWVTALSFYALLAEHGPGATRLLLTLALLLMVVAVVEVSYAMAFRDELTGLPARRALNQTLLKLGNRYTLAMLDVDHFKKFNDSYGHDVGDEVLKMVASKLARVGGGGKPFRYGGEEFTIVFAGKPVETALPHLEQVREAIAAERFMVRSAKRPQQKPAHKPKGSDKAVQITISIGAAPRTEQQRDPQAVLKAADKALYRAKGAGRNRVAS